MADRHGQKKKNRRYLPGIVLSAHNPPQGVQQLFATPKPQNNWLFRSGSEESEQPGKPKPDPKDRLRRDKNADHGPKDNPRPDKNAEHRPKDHPRREKF